MTIEEIRGAVVGGNEIDRFPIGMRVLAVDDDPTCLKLLDGLLRKCQYQVTTTNQAITALRMLRENRNRFDLVISDVHMPDMDGFKLLELVGLEMDLPVIMLSGNSDPKLVMKGITHGACDYLVKPVRLEELRNIWQHVIRRKVESKSQSKSNNQEKPNHGSEGGQEAGSGDPNGKLNRKRKDEDEDGEDNNGNEDDDPSTQKKPRVVWSIDLHRKFVAAVNQLGIEKAVPKRILDLMNVEGLTRENVASHLQKYRLYLKRISQQANMVVAFGGNKDASSYMRMNSLDRLTDFRTISSSARVPNTYSPAGMLGRLNSATGMTLHSLNSPSLIQPNHTQNSINSINNPINSLNKFQPVVLQTPQSHQNTNLFPRISPSFDLKQNTQIAEFNPVDESPIFNGSRSFQNQSSLKIAPMSSESFNLVSTSSSFLDAGENYAGASNTIGGFVNNISNNNITTTASVPIEGQSQRKGQYGKQDYGQYSNNAFSGLGGPMRLNGNGAPKSGDDYLMDQMKLQSGFVANNGYESLDDLMNGMMKREQDPTIIMDGEFGFDPYAFGSCI